MVHHFNQISLLAGRIVITDDRELKLQRWGNLLWHYVHTKIHKYVLDLADTRTG
jgi:hypothetical protein